jgi:hypothetical protein
MRPHHVAPPEPARAASSSGAFPRSLLGPFETTLPCNLDAPAMARAAVTAWITGHVDEATLADAQLLVGELVANRVGHADTPDDAVARVRVDARRPGRRAGDRAATENGRQSHERVADMHDAIARHHEDVARRLRLHTVGGGADAG